MTIDKKMAIEILDFIKQDYEKHSDKSGVKKYIEALQMGVEALNNDISVVRCMNCEYSKKIDDFGTYKCSLPQHTYAGRHYCGYGKCRKDAEN